MIYTYEIVKEHPMSGEQSKRKRKITRFEPLKVGGLYVHLGYGYRGCYRVLRLLKEDNDEAV